MIVSLSTTAARAAGVMRWRCRIERAVRGDVAGVHGGRWHLSPLRHAPVSTIYDMVMVTANVLGVCGWCDRRSMLTNCATQRVDDADDADCEQRRCRCFQRIVPVGVLPRPLFVLRVGEFERRCGQPIVHRKRHDHHGDWH